MSREKLHLMFGIHGHQPVGNFGFVVEGAFSQCYAPFFKTLARFPSLRATVHFSGVLLEWIAREQPEFLSGLRRFLREGQVELLGGGFYEPILPVIPEEDRREQIDLMTAFCERILGVRPRGLWLTERVWEPDLPRCLAAAGMRYTFVDDRHLQAAGVPASEVGGSYLTEDEGHRVRLFPIDRRLRYAMPFTAPESVLALLREEYERGTEALTVIDDVEKFGLWPGTHKALYADGWLDRFFTRLAEADDWLDVTTPMSYAAAHAPRGLVYVPQAGYAEIDRWARGPEAAESPVAATSFRHFFMRYPEANHMHKRMLDVSRKVHASSLDGAPREAAKRHLFKAQCNCAYWHGLFGGLYYPFLRDAVYEHLIRAERAVTSREPSAESYDLDCDGKPEVVLRTPGLWAFLDAGGRLVELDVVERAVNLLNTLGRRRESYHQPEDDLLVDEGLLGCFCESFHALDTEASPEAWRDGKVPFAAVPSAPRGEPRLIETGEMAAVAFSYQVEVDEKTLDVVKSVRLPRERMTVDVEYEWKGRSAEETTRLLAVRGHLSVPSALDEREPIRADGLPVAGARVLAGGQVAQARRFSVRDPHPHLWVHVEADRPVRWLYAPVLTVSRSEKGLERQCQALAFWILTPVTWRANETTRLALRLEIDPDEKTR